MKSKGKSSPGEALVVLGDQLFPLHHLERFKGMPIFMCEDYGLCTHFKYHKKKIALFLAAMRECARDYAENFDVLYVELNLKTNYFKELDKFITAEKIKTLHSFEIQDKFFVKQMAAFCAEKNITHQMHSSPAFLVSPEEFSDYLKKTKKPFMKTFYEQLRRDRQILMESKTLPLGGKFSFDTENRKPYRGEVPVPKLPEFKPSTERREVFALVEKTFPSHPGDLENFVFPTNHEDAKIWLKDFIKHRIYQFGRYEDAIDSKEPFLFHSVLSPLMNTGLLTPEDILKVILPLANKKDVPLNSIEGFVRQILGWREFVRGIYQNYSEQQDEKNFWKHHRKLTSDWYEGTTGLPPVDDAIRSVLKHGWSHHIERLMVLSNTMLLAQLDPKEVHKWFMEMYVDSADWVMGPNVYGMGQFSDGGIFATKPYICGSNYWIKMSNYKKGPWCDTIDGLYWSFIERNLTFFKGNPRLSMMSNMIKKISPERMKILNAAAEKFVSVKTQK